jgi:hypothetical protein
MSDPSEDDCSQQSPGSSVCLLWEWPLGTGGDDSFPLRLLRDRHVWSNTAFRHASNLTLQNISLGRTMRI